MYYTGVGPRQIPQDVYDRLYRLGAFLGSLGWVLRSGGADGADTAFEKGADSVGGQKEIYLPWKRFNKNPSSLFEVTPAAIEASLRFHPTAHLITKHGVRCIMGRNLYQVLGQTMDTPSKFLVTWTPYSTMDALNHGKKIGGTGQAIRIADHYRVPLYNLSEGDDFESLHEDLQSGLLSQRPDPPVRD